MKKASKCFLLTLAILLLIAVLFSQTAPLSLLIFHYWDCISNNDTPTEPLQFYLPIENDLVLASFGAKSSRNNIHSVPLFAYYQNAHWNVSVMNDNLMRLNGELLENAAETIGSSFVMQLGNYTIISVGSDYIEHLSVPKSEIYDNIETEPFLVSQDLIREDDKNRDWGCPYLVKTQYGRVWASTLDLSNYSYFFIIKNIPGDYELHIGDQVFRASNW